MKKILSIMKEQGGESSEGGVNNRTWEDYDITILE